MTLTAIDHVAFTVADVDVTCAFYDRLFGLTTTATHMQGGRISVRQIRIGDAVLSIHQADNDITLVAKKPTVGAVDLCFRWSGTAASAVALLRRHNVEIVEGPAPRTFSDGRPSQSVYFYDPDGNLIELMSAS